MPICIGFVDVEVRIRHCSNSEEADAADGSEGQAQAQGFVFGLADGALLCKENSGYFLRQEKK